MANEVAKKEEFELPMIDDLQEIMSEELEGLKIDYDRIKIPSGGGLAFEVPGDNPDEPDTVKEVKGVIVGHHAINAWWKDSYDGANVTPDCSSMNGNQGLEKETGAIKDCSTCPYNQYGSSGNGKACKNMRRIYILQSGAIFPLLLTLPPTSIGNFADYVGKRVVSKGLRTYGVVTKFSLKKAKSNSGISYSQTIFSLENILDGTKTNAMKKITEDLKESTRKVKVTNETQDEEDIPF